MMDPVNLASSTDKPRIGITTGDPSGIGPEIVLKAAADEEVRSICIPVIVGDAAELNRQARVLGLASDFPIRHTSEFNLPLLDSPIVLDTCCLDEHAKWGALSATSGRAAIAAIEACVRLCLAGKLDAMTTAPINKESLNLPGSPFPCHTETPPSFGPASHS